jgi:hypothetical protein
MQMSNQTRSNNLTGVMAGAQEKLVKHITSGDDAVKLTDGHKELRKFDKATSPDQINNMVRWILAQ